MQKGYKGLTQNEVEFKKKFHIQTFDWTHSLWVRLMFFLFFCGFLIFILAPKLVPAIYDVQVGSVSEITIFAPKQIENKRATLALAEEKVKKVIPIYQTIQFQSDALIDRIFEKIAQINEDREIKVEDKATIYRLTLPQFVEERESLTIRTYRDQGGYSLEFLDLVSRKMQEQRYLIPEELFFKLPRVVASDLALMKTVVQDVVTRWMSEQIIDVELARTRVAAQVNSSNLTKNTTREIAQEMILLILTPNTFLDQSATYAAQVAARESIEPVYLNKGDIVVNKGEVITEHMYESLASLDLLKAKSNMKLYVGLCFIVALICSLLYVAVKQSALAIRGNNKQLLLFLSMLSLNITIMVLISWYIDQSFVSYVTPVALGSILIAILLDARLALISAVLFAVLSSLMLNDDYTQVFDFQYGFYTLIVCAIAVFSTQRASKRSSMFRVGLLISAGGLFTLLTLHLLEGDISQKEFLLSLSFAAISGILTVILVLGVLPFFEFTFGILSPLKLVEISNPNHPLLRKLLTETPGTYHHSIMVGNLAEAAAESIGADGLLCRVGAFYHDVGKTKRPSYFIENQTNIENPHDRIHPTLSRSIIVAHVREGVEMLSAFKIPKQIQDIAEQHHGTTLLQYFYHKAIKLAEEESIAKIYTEQDFRYPGPKAQTKEAAIIGIADSVEAAVRSLRNPTLEQIDSMVNRIIKSRLDDEQFHECDLTFKELDTIAKTLNETLLGIFHSRIEYPSELLLK